mgnify:CR=1 FL=1
MNEEKYLQLELLIGENQKYNTTTLGFNIAPKINSFGRLPELVNPIISTLFLKDVDQNLQSNSTITLKNQIVKDNLLQMNNTKTF